MSIGGWNEDELDRFIRDRLAPQFAQAGALGSMPVGACCPWIVSAAPAGFLLIAGQAVTTDYPALRNLLLADGSPHGVSGSDPLLPDLRGRVPFGLDNMGGSDAGRLTVANTLGGVGGEQLVTLDVTQIPAHTHTVNSTFNAAGLGDKARAAHPSNTGSDTTLTSGSAGGGGAHENMPPYVLLNWIVKA